MAAREICAAPAVKKKIRIIRRRKSGRSMVSRFIVGRTMGSPGNEMNSRTLPKPVTVNHQAYGGKQLRLAFPEIVCLTAPQLLGPSPGSVKQATTQSRDLLS